MRKKQFSDFSSQIFFGFWAKIFSNFRRKIFKSCQNYLLRVHRNNLWLQKNLKRFEPFWIFCRNLWHGSQISIYVSRVKIAEETVFLFFFSEFFRILRENFFRLSAKICQKFVKTTFYVSRGTICGLNFFLSFESFPIFCRNHWHGSQVSIYVSRVKFAEEIVFFILPFWIFPDFERENFQTFGRKRQEFVKTTYYVSRGTICGLNFFYVLNRFRFSAETIGMVLKILSTSPD